MGNPLTGQYRCTIYGLSKLSNMMDAIYALESCKIIPESEMLDLVLMELVGNAFKYGNLCNDQLPITVDISWNTHSTSIVVKDEGLSGGLSEELFSGEIDFSFKENQEWDPKNTLGFGIPLVRTFTEVNFEPSGDVVYKLPQKKLISHKQEEKDAAESESS